MARMIGKWALFLVLIWARMATAEQSLSLRECVELARQQNKQILMAKEDFAKARGQITESRSYALPNLSIGGQASYSKDRPFFMFPDSSGDYVKIPMAEKDNYQITTTIMQPIFSARAFIAPQASSIFSKFAEQNVITTEQQITLGVKQAYYGILLAGQMAEVSRQALAQAEATLDRIQQYRKIGQVSDFDVLRAEVEVANLRPQVMQAENGFAIAALALKNVLGLNVNTAIVLTDTLAYEALNVTQDQALITAQENRPDLKAMDYQVQGWRKYLQAQQLNRLPELTGLIQYQAQYDHYKVDGDSWNSTLTGVLAMTMNNIPFLDGGRSTGLICQAKADWRKARLLHDSMFDNMVLEVKQGFLTTEEASKRVEATRLNINRAHDALKIAELQFTNGQITQLEVRDARLALTLARTNYCQALFDYNVARAKLDAAMGVIK